MKPAAALVSILAALAAAPAGAQQAPSAANTANAANAASREKAIFAVSDDDQRKWNLTLGNIGNALDALGAGGAEIELVVYGPGIDMLRKDSAVAKRLAEAESRGVRIVACQNSMRAFHLEATDLAPGVGTVPSGVVELMKREHEGYAYIRS